MFLQGDAYPHISEGSLQVELSKVKDNVLQMQCVTSTIDDESNFNLTTTDTGNLLPNSRYITLSKHIHPVIIAEIQVYGGKER